MSNQEIIRRKQYCPAVGKVKIIVFWFCWQQDFEWRLIEAGLLIKQR